MANKKDPTAKMPEPFARKDIPTSPPKPTHEAKSTVSISNCTFGASANKHTAASIKALAAAVVASANAAAASANAVAALAGAVKPAQMQTGIRIGRLDD